MMTKRECGGRAYWDDEDREPGEKVATQVFVQENEEWSGLFDADGRKLTRPRPPFGFVPK